MFNFLSLFPWLLLFPYLLHLKSKWNIRVNLEGKKWTNTKTAAWREWGEWVLTHLFSRSFNNEWQTCSTARQSSNYGGYLVCCSWKAVILGSIVLSAFISTRKKGYERADLWVLPSELSPKSWWCVLPWWLCLWESLSRDRHMRPPVQRVWILNWRHFQLCSSAERKKTGSLKDGFNYKYL